MEARSIKDNINVLRHLNWSRSINIIKVYSSYLLSSIIKRPIHWGIPFSIDFEPTTSCNLRCPECPSGLRKFSRPTGMLEMNRFKKTVDEISKHSFYLMFYFQGEPFLNSNFLEMVTYAKSKNLYVATSTNAHYLTEEKSEEVIASGLDRLIISIDGIDQEAYGKYRIGGHLEKVLEGTKRIVEAKRKQQKGPHIIWQFIVFKHNEHQINDVKDLGKELGVDEVRIKSAQIYEPETKQDWIPDNKGYSRYGKDGTIDDTNVPNKCWRLWHTSVFTWDGKVLPCCYDKDADNQMGNLKDLSFKDVWSGKAYKDFRKSILKDRKQNEICRNCGEGMKVWRK